MSRSTRANAPLPGTMGPPQDVLMGPPPLPPQITLSASADKTRERENQDLAEKYKRLKRKYFELEEKNKDITIEQRLSGERAIRWRLEKSRYLDRIAELEAAAHHPNSPQPFFSSAYPSSLSNPRTQKRFIRNLDMTLDEAEREDHSVDPLLMSRHVGPAARKRQEAELKERMEEEAREARRAARKPRGGKRDKVVISRADKEVVEREPGPMMFHSTGSQNPSQQILVSSTGTRLRIKPPARPPQESAPPLTTEPHIFAGPSRSHHHDPPPRSESPGSPGDEDVPLAYTHSGHGHNSTPDHGHPNDHGRPLGAVHGQVTLSPSMQYRPTPSDPYKAAQSQMQMTLRPSHTAPPHSPGPPVLSPNPNLNPVNPIPGVVGNGSAGGGPGSGARAKPKRLKAHTVTSKVYSIPMVPRDKKGKPVLPLNVGIMTVITLGEVCLREHFHTERYIFPVGYHVQRRYLSTIDPNAEVAYNCTILDGGDGPKFKIVASDAPDKPIVAGTATGAWSVIVRAANHIRNRQHSNSVSGPDFFGLGQNTIKHLLQELPNSNQLSNYVWQHFVEGGPLGGRHAAVIPALPEAEPHDFHDPTPPYYEEQKELQIIQVENHDHGSNGVSVGGNGEMKSITFHQEYPDREGRPQREGRGRRTSLQQQPQFEEYNPEQRHGHTHHSASHSRHSHDQYPHSHSHSPDTNHRNASHSPVMHRDREPYSPRSQPHASPYQQQAQTPSMPAGFASIMNAYPSAPIPGSPEAGSPYDRESVHTGGRSRRNTNGSMMSVDQ